ncbi:MAG: hypothetical protein RL385_994 [Pseudomonadota bacterium]
MQEFVPVADRPFLALLTAASLARSTGLVVLRDADGDRHGVTLESGFVRAVHVAGRYDPLLSLLEARGLMDRPTRMRCQASLGDAAARSGSVVGQLCPQVLPALRDVLREQQTDRLEALLELAASRGHDARLEPCALAVEDAIVRIPLGSLLRALGRFPGDSSAESTTYPSSRAAVGHEVTPGPPDAKRRLRSLAKTLHPDRHLHLPPDARRALERELAEATARYHGFIRVA